MIQYQIQKLPVSETHYHETEKSKDKDIIYNPWM